MIRTLNGSVGNGASEYGDSEIYGDPGSVAMSNADEWVDGDNSRQDTEGGSAGGESGAEDGFDE